MATLANPHHPSELRLSNLASAIKEEIIRLARREIRGELQHLKSASARYRSEIAALKRKTVELQRVVSRLSNGKASAVAPAGHQEEPSRVRYSAPGLRSLRNRLGLSAEDMGTLIGASGQSVYKWEAEKAQPRRQHVVAIAALRKLGKREAAARLSEIK